MNINDIIYIIHNADHAILNGLEVTVYPNEDFIRTDDTVIEIDMIENIQIQNNELHFSVKNRKKEFVLEIFELLKVSPNEFI